MQDMSDAEAEAVWKEATSGTAAPAPTAEEPQTEAASEEAAEEAREATAETAGAETPQDEAADQPPNTAPETNPTTDIWANAPEELRSAFLETKSRADRLEHRVKSDEGRISRFQRERDELRKQLGAVNSVAEQEDLEAYLASEDWKKVKSEYGDDLKPVFTALETLAARDKANEARLSQLTQARSETTHEQNIDWLNDKAPGWVELFDRPDFDPWLNAQPEGVREMIARNVRGLVDPAEVKVVYDLFSAEIGAQGQAGTAPQTTNGRKREKQLEGSRSVSSRAPILTGPEQDDEAVIWKEAVAAATRA